MSDLSSGRVEQRINQSARDMRIELATKEEIDRDLRARIQDLELLGSTIDRQAAIGWSALQLVKEIVQELEQRRQSLKIDQLRSRIAGAVDEVEAFPHRRRLIGWMKEKMSG